MSNCIQKPGLITPDFEHIPGELKNHTQWVLWKMEHQKGRWTKIPYAVSTGKRASATNPTTWATFAEAEDAYSRGGWDGVGFVLTSEDSFTCIDLDHCPEAPWALGIINHVNSYTEVSPSGEGYHLWMVASKPADMRCKSSRFHKGAVEVYDAGRWMTMTGKPRAHVSGRVEGRQEMLEHVCAPLLKKPAQTASAPAARLPAHTTVDSDVLLSELRRIKPTAHGLFTGEDPGLDDASASDQSLMNALAWLTGSDPERMDQLFRQSARMRSKWDEQRGELTYGQRTIHTAIQGCTGAYDPNRRINGQATVHSGGGLTPEESSRMEAKRRQNHHAMAAANMAEVSHRAPAFEPLDAKVKERSRPGALHIPESCQDTFLYRYSVELAKAAEFPIGTAFMVGMGMLSGILSTTFCTQYLDEERLPLGLYILASQPPGMAKSRILSRFQSPWRKAIWKFNADAVKKHEDQKGQSGEGDDPEEPRLLMYPSSNVTVQALEANMAEHKTGHFMLASAEQGLVGVLFGMQEHDGTADLDLPLKGFNGEFHLSSRVGRCGIMAEVYGTIVILAQPGTASRLLNGSGGTGLAERFDFIEEPHLLAERTYEAYVIDEAAARQYNTMIEGTLHQHRMIPVDKRGRLDELTSMKLGDTRTSGHSLLRNLMVEQRKDMVHYVDRGENLMAGRLSKNDIRVMKIATTLWLSDRLSQGLPPLDKIPDSYIARAMDLIKAVNRHTDALMHSLDVIGDDAARQVVLRQFERKDERSHRQLLNNLQRTSPFKDHRTPRRYASEMVQAMIAEGDLMAVGIDDTQYRHLRLG
ncbi:DUF3987 domain-containing protein [Halomonas cupida]|uniref:phage NrS-1 polymerase family protein n=1 Tax=Halomonas cupida TaxID=44933 RepID=UPI003A951DE3